MELTIAETNNLTDNNGNLDLSNIKITKLPDNLTVDGSLNISNTKIYKLPHNLTVKGDLNIGYTDIKKIPSDLCLSGCCLVDGIPFESIEIPNNIKPKIKRSSSEELSRNLFKIDTEEINDYFQLKNKAKEFEEYKEECNVIAFPILFFGSLCNVLLGLLFIDGFHKIGVGFAIVGVILVILLALCLSISLINKQLQNQITDKTKKIIKENNILLLSDVSKIMGVLNQESDDFKYLLSGCIQERKMGSNNSEEIEYYVDQLKFIKKKKELLKDIEFYIRSHKKDITIEAEEMLNDYF
mgnify:CR=1 FL=1|jgi:hypothetical protein